MNHAENNILALAQRYSLEEGKFADYYKLHSTWCLTKRGAERIREAEGIIHTMPECDITPVSIAYRSSFGKGESPNMNTHVVGSCRFDGTKQTPERSHAPEMAFKRMLVRGTIAERLQELQLVR